MKSDIKARINEADVCSSMGLYYEALDIYNGVRGQECNLEPMNPCRLRRRQRRVNL